MKPLVLVILPFLFIACTKSAGVASGTTPPPEGNVLIDKNEQPVLYNFLYENGCDREKKATYWFGYASVNVNQPGIGGLRVVLSVEPKGKAISLAYRVNVTAYGFPDGMTLLKKVFTSEDFAVDNSGITLGSDGFKISEQAGKVILTTTKIIPPLQEIESIQLAKDNRTDVEIENFIGEMGLRSSQFALNCGQ